MKILTTKTVKKFHPEYGWIDQVQFRLFGFHFWTENYKSAPIEDDVPTLEYRAMGSLISEKYRQVSFSELSNAEFDKFQKQLMSQLK